MDIRPPREPGRDVIAASTRLDAPDPDDSGGPPATDPSTAAPPNPGGREHAGREGPGWDDEADRWLVGQAVSGGSAAVRAQAFEVLLRRHQNRVYRIALRMTGNREDAEDIAQDVAVALWRVLASFTGTSTFSTWLYRVVLNRCRNHHRARQVVTRDTVALPEPDQPGQPDRLSTASAERRVLDAARLDAAAAALAALPGEQRAALVLVQIEGLSYREAAAITGISEAALRSRLERGRRALLHAVRDWT